MYYITCTYCKKLYIGETGRWLGDQFQEHPCNVKRNDRDVSKPVARHFDLPNHSKQHMAVWVLFLHLSSSESHKTLELKFIFHIYLALLIPMVSMSTFHLTNLFLFL